MLAKVYVETSVVSYLTAPLSNDLVVAGHQRTTRDWWALRGRFELQVSELVLLEASAGDSQMAAARTQALAGISVLELSASSKELAKALITRGPLPPTAAEDALHIATAVTNGLQYLVTWNCRHIANAAMRPQIERICLACGYEPSIICTPEELLDV